MGALAPETTHQAEPRTPQEQSPQPHLRELAGAAGIELDERALTRFAAYRRLLVAWNDRFNLTAITEPAAIDRRLILDALLMLPAIDAASVGKPAFQGWP